MTLELIPFSYTFPGNTNKLFLNKAITLNPHGCYLITGSSGVGKSTFLKILKGFFPEFLDGTLEPQKISFKDSFYLFQNPYSQLIQSSPYLEFLFSMENKQFSPEEITAQLSLIKKFNLTDIINHKTTKNLSHGECQKLLFVSLVAAKPNWIFLDEPTAFIDPKTRAEIYQMISVEKQHCGFLIIDHHINEIGHFCDGFFHLKMAENEQDVEILFHQNISDLKINNTNNKKIGDTEKSLLKIGSDAFNAEINVKEFSAYYKKNNHLFNPVSFHLKTSTITTVMGKSGQGKSTLLKAILGNHKDVVGSIEMRVNGRVVKSNCRHRHLGFLFQNPEHHFFYDTVAEEIHRSDTSIDACWSLLKVFKLEKCLNLNPFLLSEGQKRRLSFLLVLLQKKEFLILDEPTFGQDSEQVEIIKECLILARNMGQSVLMVSHNKEFFQSISDNVITLEECES